MIQLIAELIELIIDLLLWALRISIAIGPYLFLFVLVVVITSGA